jgi:hypothetical protein
MDRASLKKLAQLTADEKEVSPKLASFVLDRLSRADLKTYLFYLKSELAKGRVHVRVPGGRLDAAFRAKMQQLFPGKDLSIEADPSIGGGMQVEYDDTIIDVSLKSLIERTFSRIKESI